jgi:hypothetical protein
MLLVFIGLSFYLFEKTEFAHYIYILAAISLVYPLSETRRNDFLKSIFSQRHYFQVRLIENGIATLPFVVFLISKSLGLAALLASLLGCIMALLQVDQKVSLTLPSPFSKKPFEFTIGFRNSFYLFGLSYILTLIAVSVGNFNLGVFSLVLVFLFALSFYTNPEDEFFVWVFSMSPKRFLLEKIKTAALYATVLSSPVLMTLLLFFKDQFDIILVFQLLGYFALATIILAKYSAYPKPMNVPQGILVVLTIQFPPLIFFVIPYFYIQSIKRLNEFLA